MKLTLKNNTFAQCRSERLRNSIEDLFNQFIIKLRETNEIKYENIFIDGTKIEMKLEFIKQ